jgi:HlyD family secretion protein
MDRKIKKKKWPPKKIAGFSAAGLFMIFIVFNLPVWDASTKIRVDKNKITISETIYAPFREYIPVTANVLPENTNFLDAVEGGRVDTVYTEAGSFVTAGDKILKLDNTTLHIQILSQDALVVEQRNLLTSTRFSLEQNHLYLQQQLLEHEYQIQRLKRKYERHKQLYDENVISEQEYEDTKDEYEYQQKRQRLNFESFKKDSIFQEVQIKQLERSLDRLEENLKIARKRLDALIIRAPISGQLTAMTAEEGQLIVQAQRIGQIDALDDFKVRAAIDEHYLPRVFTGEEAEFEWDGQKYGLTIKKIFPEVTEGRFEVDLYFSGVTPAGIRRGQTLHLQLYLGNLSDAILIPRGGFYQNTGGQWIYVVHESGEYASRRDIKLGRQNTEMFEVIDGLQPGENVVTSSYETFGDMDKLIF